MRIMEYEAWHSRQAELLRDAESARLARRVRAEQAKPANGALSEEFGLPRRRMAARAMAVVTGLFR